jgi:hypothetical protein
MQPEAGRTGRRLGRRLKPQAGEKTFSLTPGLQVVIEKRPAQESG